jgi:rare lipoprotein A
MSCDTQFRRPLAALFRRLVLSACAAAVPLAGLSASAGAESNILSEIGAHAVVETIEASEPATRPLAGGYASYYASKFEGRPTASGERYKGTELTAAHRSLPFGSRVRVINPANGRSVTVRINDRGPFSHGRVIDVSRAAALELGLIARGSVDVDLELIEG